MEEIKEEKTIQEAIEKVEEEQTKQNKAIDEAIQKLNTLSNKLMGSNLDDSEKVLIMSLVSDRTQRLNAARVEYLMKSNAELKELYLK